MIDFSGKKIFLVATRKLEGIMAAFVKFENVKKVYQMGEVTIEALKDATFQIDKGEICVIVGASGAGKTTLLNILGGMDTLTSGPVSYTHLDVYKRQVIYCPQCTFGHCGFCMPRTSAHYYSL